MAILGPWELGHLAYISLFFVLESPMFLKQIPIPHDKGWHIGKYGTHSHSLDPRYPLQMTVKIHLFDT